MPVCESCGSQDIRKSGEEIICEECGFTRDYTRFRRLRKRKCGLRY